MAGYSFTTEGIEALASGSAETILSMVNATGSIARLVEMGVSFDGITASDVPVVVELCLSSEATAGAFSAATVRQLRGATRTAEAIGRHSYTAEPTVLTVVKEWSIRPDGGVLIIQFPLGREPEQIASAAGLCIRCTSSSTVGVNGYMEFDEG